MRGLVALPLALSAALLVPAVHWCPIPWEQTTVECVAQCSITKSGQCRDVAFATSRSDEDSAPIEETPGACPVAASSCEESCTPCPLPTAFPEGGDRGRAYILGDSPDGLLIRTQLLPDISSLAIPPPRTGPETSPRPAARPPEPEIRPPTCAWTSVRLARAPPGA